jgi:hypothetical protein
MIVKGCDSCKIFNTETPLFNFYTSTCNVNLGTTEKRPFGFGVVLEGYSNAVPSSEVLCEPCLTKKIKSTLIELTQKENSDDPCVREPEA